MNNSELLGQKFFSDKEHINFHVFSSAMKDWIMSNGDCTLIITVVKETCNSVSKV